MEVRHWVEEVERLIGDRQQVSLKRNSFCQQSLPLQVVTAQWLLTTYSLTPQMANRFIPIPFSGASRGRVLYDTFQRRGGQCDAVFCLIGVTKSDGQHLIQLISYPKLEGDASLICRWFTNLTDALNNFESLSSAHVYWYCPPLAT